MTLMMLRHSSKPERREAIGTAGLRPTSPSGPDGHYSWLKEQPAGIYGVPVFNPWSTDDGSVMEGEAWYASEYDDIWIAFWCGPMINDPIVKGAVVIQPDENVPALLVQAARGEDCAIVDLGVPIAGE